MKLLFSERFRKSYTEAPAQIQKAFDKQSKYLLQNVRHPSLQTKKYDKKLEIWQARVTRGWRFYFSIRFRFCGWSTHK